MLGMGINRQYFLDIRSIDRIKALAQDAKIILSVRDPVDWIVSSFFQINQFDRKPSFEKFVNGYTIGGPRGRPHFALANRYVQRTIKAFRTAFGTNLLLHCF
jgi:hypothetical protein